MIRDESSKERLITKERKPLTVPRNICSGTGLISKVGSDGNLVSIIVIESVLTKIVGRRRPSRKLGVCERERGRGGRGCGHPPPYDSLRSFINDMCSFYASE